MNLSVVMLSAQDLLEEEVKIDEEGLEEVNIGEEGYVIVCEDEEGLDLMVIDQCREDSIGDLNYLKHFPDFFAFEVVWLPWMGDIFPVVVLGQDLEWTFCFVFEPRPVVSEQC